MKLYTVPPAAVVAIICQPARGFGTVSNLGWWRYLSWVFFRRWKCESARYYQVYNSKIRRKIDKRWVCFVHLYTLTCTFVHPDVRMIWYDMIRYAPWTWRHAYTGGERGAPWFVQKAAWGNVKPPTYSYTAAMRRARTLLLLIVGVTVLFPYYHEPIGSHSPHVCIYGHSSLVHTWYQVLPVISLENAPWGKRYFFN